MKTGWQAFGNEVPQNRLIAGFEVVREIAPELSTEECFAIVGKTANHIRHDSPYNIVGAVECLDEDLNRIDLIGRYRLLATMLTD